MEASKTFTFVRVAIPNAAFAQVWFKETPASLTMCTPNAAVQVQVGSVEAADAKTLPNPPMTD